MFIAAIVALAAAAAGLGLLLGRSRRKAAATERRLRGSLEQLQQAFARFAPAEVVEDIVGYGVSVRSEKKDITVLFADLRGFTALSESMDPGSLVEILNGYLTVMSRAITAHRGHVSKFIGDGIMAIFGALEPNPWQTIDAALAALAMREALAGYNAKLESQGHRPLALGIGIHRGLAVAGVIGTPELMEYTVIGSTVNVASRVEELTRHFLADILLTEEAKAALDPRFDVRALPPAAVKGLSIPVSTYALEGFAGPVSS